MKREGWIGASERGREEGTSGMERTAVRSRRRDGDKRKARRGQHG